MRLLRLEVEGLRNLKPVELMLAEGLTMVVGRNGQGKTSLLESVYLLATGRSFRTRRLDDLVSWKGGPARVGGRLRSQPGETGLVVVLEAGARRLMVDGSPSGLESYLGRLDVIDLSTERSRVVHGAPDERRRFLDRGVAGLRPGYLRELAGFRRALQQRNALLRARPTERNAELGVWDDRLLVAGASLHDARRDYAESLSPMIGEIGRALFPETGLPLSVRYRPSPSTGNRPDDRFSQDFAEALDRGRSGDLAAGYTREGPHRDDLTVELAGVDLRRFGSAGQVRAAMIALKLAKLSLLRKTHGEAPMFLMDDFDTDLDDARMSALAGFLNDGGFQTVVATSKESQIGRLGVAFAKLRVDDGVAYAA